MHKAEICSCGAPRAKTDGGDKWVYLCPRDHIGHKETVMKTLEERALYTTTFPAAGRKDRPLFITEVSAKKQHEFSTEMVIRGALDGVPFTCNHLLMEGQGCEGDVKVHGRYLTKRAEEELLVAILMLLDENADKTLEHEMARICGEAVTPGDGEGFE